jgi:hypothetical protein
MKAFCFATLMDVRHFDRRLQLMPYQNCYGAGQITGKEAQQPGCSRESARNKSRQQQRWNHRFVNSCTTSDFCENLLKRSSPRWPLTVWWMSRHG